MDNMKLQPAVLVVSDTASKDPSTDKAGNILTDTFAGEGGGQWRPPVVKIVPDSVLDIQRTVQQWSDCEDYFNLVITTGGTGFAVKDVTPEAVSPLIHRSAPGLVHAMLAASLQVTLFASMSRPVAGVRNKTLIITLPGSPKGAKENLQAVLKLLPHACLQAAGGDSRTIHAGGLGKLEKEAGVAAIPTGLSASSDGHHHHHHDHSHAHGGHQVPKVRANSPSNTYRSNDPRLGALHRARSSPYPMLTVAEAVSTIVNQAPPSIPGMKPLNPDLVGSVVAEDLYATEEVPAYRASIVDGYAIVIPEDGSTHGKSQTGVYPVASVSLAQAASLPPPLKAGDIARITTGAPLPEYANAVVMVENTLPETASADGSEETTVRIMTHEVEIGENIREPGSDVKLGSLIIRKGTMISSIGGEVGVLAAAGIRNVPVYEKPRIGVMSTGDEVTDISYNEKLSGGQIRDSNRPSLLSVLRGWGLCSEVVDLGIARDTPDGELEKNIRGGFRIHDLDVIVTTGGVSMGELDLLKPTIERSLGGTVHFGRVSMKPGKPTTFASVPFKDSKSGEKVGRLIFGLPGNPASAIVTAHLFVLPALQKMCGREGKGLERVMVRLAEKMKCDKARVEYHRAVVSVGNEGRLIAKSTGMQRSSRVGSLATANALLVLPQIDGSLEAGQMCEALMMGPVVGL